MSNVARSAIFATCTTEQGWATYLVYISITISALNIDGLALIRELLLD